VGASGRGSKELGDIELCVPRARTYSAVEVICRYARRVGNTVAKQLDTAVEASHRRPIRGRYRVLVLDGVVLRRRTGVGSVKRVVLVALGMRWDGRKEVIDFFTAKGESQGAWEGFDGRRS
jgi:transposase-like protein